MSITSLVLQQKFDVKRLWKLPNLPIAPRRGLLAWLAPFLVFWLFRRAVGTHTNAPLFSTFHKDKILFFLQSFQ